ncbi:glycoside hydrolase family 3 C-terminal domain-containing protein [Pedobacter sp. MC2016-14]|uniref:glycoside hydrolase family 3 N-terminal domain-containing protein n=1 Tax=Pedobacter sp. MC2016-14 TaxID=2897327 RepID=UPI001E45B69E|nr:glycoside hydrolase family 3 N-terminal domain-containing protein [Pedobacter sp. MC2016-14]MCD0489295.1 glycoside hydrolase family 3 C-terminal domain-containing protein [Pedobacter sp. MC2016-14]
MMKFFSLPSLFFLLAIQATVAQDVKINKRVDSLMKLMTLEEKVGQLNQYSGSVVTGPVNDAKTNMLNDIKQGKVGSMLNVRGVKDTREIQAVALQSRLKIPLLFSLDVIHGYKTIFPVPLAEAASWDLDAIKSAAHIAAKEAAASGIHWTFAPMVDVGRDPRWGRVMEGAGEDTYLGSKIATARVKGFQGEQLGGLDAIMACAKHFAAYGAAIAGRDYNAVDLSNQQLWETYLPPFKAAADAGVATFMNSFNTINGIPATGNSYLQRNILKGKWNFGGFVVSDWGSIAEMVPWGFAENQKDAALKAITAGSDMDMESLAYKNNLVKLVNEGAVPIALVDDALKRILYQKFLLGLFDDPYKFSNLAREKKVMADVKHPQIAREVAEKSIVLLKNNGQLLPLTRDTKNIVVIGPLAHSRKDMEGGWIVASDTTKVTSLYEGLVAKAGKNVKFTYVEGCGINGMSTAGFASAVAAAKSADLVIMALGESAEMTGEAKSRTDIHLPGVQEDLFVAVKATGKPVVSVLMAGRPMIFNKVADQSDAIVYAWLLGEQAGHAIANVLYGDYNPSGKLPSTFPRSVGQIPLSYQTYNTGRPVTDPKDIRYKSGYIDELNSPRYAFGYGLSYTTFNYTNLKSSATTITLTPESTVQLSFTLTNTGKYAGAEVVQLYIRDLVSSVVRPVKELKDFQKVMLKAGESTTITFTIDKDKLSYFNQDLHWVAEPGAFSLMIGSASDDIRLSATLNLTQ